MEIDIKCTHDLSRRYAENYAIAMVDIDNFKREDTEWSHILKFADDALYVAKNAGRNKVSIN